MMFPPYYPGQSVAPGTVYATAPVRGARAFAMIVDATYPWVTAARDDGPVLTVRWQDFFRTYREVIPTREVTVMAGPRGGIGV